MTETCMKLLHVSDLHFNPLQRIPQSRTDSFHADINAKWTWICEFARAQGITTGVISGDIFHLKRSSEYRPEDLNYYTNLIKASKMEWYCIPGNHDLPASAYDNLHKSAYQTLCNATPNLHDISWGAVSFGEAPNQIHVVGIPYLKLKETMGTLQNVNAGLARYEGLKVVLLHIDALPDPGDFTMWDIVKYDEILDAVPLGDIFCLGHIHQGYSVYAHQQGDRTQLVSKPWSFARVVKDYYNQTDVITHQHHPSVAVLDLVVRDGVTGASINYHPIPHRPFESAFEGESLARQLEGSAKVKSFIEDLKRNYGNTSQAFSIVDPQTQLEGMELPLEVRDLINHYLEG